MGFKRSLVRIQSPRPQPEGEATIEVIDASATKDGFYLVLDAPLDGSIVFVERKRSAAESPGPLSDGDLARLAHGDTEGTSIGGMDAGGCDAAQNAEDRGQTGPCGNVMKVTLREGKYAILGDMPEVVPPPPMAVLEVLP